MSFKKFLDKTPWLFYSIPFAIIGAAARTSPWGNVFIAYISAIILLYILFKKDSLKLIAINTAIAFSAFYSGGYIESKLKSANHAGSTKYNTVIAQVEKTSSAKGSFSNKIDLKIKRCKEAKEIENLKITIFSKFNSKLKPGEIITTKIKTQKKEDLSKFEIRDNSIGSMFTKKMFFKRLKKYSNKFSLENLKLRIDSAISKMSSKTKTLFKALFMGEKETSHEYAIINNQFNIWGIGHLLARSGLHLVLILIIILGLLKLLFLPIATRRIVAIFIIITFYIISAKAVPFTRALNMFLISEAAISTKHNTNMLSIFSLNTVLSILYSPIIVFFLDFQLSFGITLILILCSSWKREEQPQIIDPKI